MWTRGATLSWTAVCGLGYERWPRRRGGASGWGAGAYTSGPLSFMDIFDKMCFTVSSAGGRRGAQMGTFDIGHPDVMEFIRAKRERDRKSTRLNSSHSQISYAVFCLQNKTQEHSVR